MGLEGMLKRRGFHLLSRNPAGRLLFPADFPSAAQDRLYSLLFSYGFRTLLKDLILHREQISLPNLTRYCAADQAEQYLAELQGMSLVTRETGGTLRLTRYREVLSFGDTLEWFLAQILIREMGCEAWWNVVLKGEGSGGDFDVLADWEGRLVYIEAKSAPPKSVENENIRAFLGRSRDLRPDGVIFLEDTTLRMRDKIFPAFVQEISRTRQAGPGRADWEEIQPETFRYGNLFLTNAKPGILENLRFCLAQFLRGPGIF